MYYQIYVYVDTNKYACLSRQNRKLCYFHSVNDATIFQDSENIH